MSEEEHQAEQTDHTEQESNDQKPQAVEAPVYVVEFKGSRKEYYRDPYALPINVGDFVIVQVERGEDMGRIILKLASEKAQTANVRPLPVLRIATDEELARDADNRRKELDACNVCKDKAAEHGLKMKVVDAEWQFDGNKMTFYFTADKRVDFRRLVKDLASTYKTRIELRQIGARDEARRVGGIGPCGFEQCCTLFLKEFEPITTQLARDQNLSLNPAKISGNCGRLLCCLRYESTYYKEATRLYPQIGTEWTTPEGTGTIIDIQILRERVAVRLSDGQRDYATLDDIRRTKAKKDSWYE